MGKAGGPLSRKITVPFPPHPPAPHHPLAASTRGELNRRVRPRPPVLRRPQSNRGRVGGVPRTHGTNDNFYAPTGNNSNSPAGTGNACWRFPHAEGAKSAKERLCDWIRCRVDVPEYRHPSAVERHQVPGIRMALPSATSHRADDQEGFPSCGVGYGQGCVDGIMGQILFAGEVAGKGTPLQRPVVADGSAAIGFGRDQSGLGLLQMTVPLPFFARGQRGVG
ncbi:MAG: hypothetical protein RIS76_249 [Verrucomicrobiota bacterium]